MTQFSQRLLTSLYFKTHTKKKKERKKERTEIKGKKKKKERKEITFSYSVDILRVFVAMKNE
jgi:hypothetical protein